MMDRQIHRYELDGLLLEIPAYYDEKTDCYIEEYPDFENCPQWTPKGHMLRLTLDNTCPYAVAIDNERCMYCGPFRQGCSMDLVRTSPT